MIISTGCEATLLRAGNCEIELLKNLQGKPKLLKNKTGKIQEFNQQVLLNQLNTFLDLFHSNAGFLDIAILSLKIDSL